MSRKTWAALTLSLLLSAFALIICSVVLIDPFEIYHKATAFTPPIQNGTQIYSNAGIAKSYEYDSVIIGSSMTENFTPSQFDRLFGGSFVKLPINAGSPFNHRQMLDMAFANQTLKTVVYGVDIELMTYFYSTPKCEMPDYLYDDNLLNDAPYWFNLSVLGKYIPACLKTWGEYDPCQRDSMYTWGDMYPYGKEAALRTVSLQGGTVEQDPPNETPVLAQQTMLNVKHNLLPFIQEHPETEFIFFFPPYSLLRWQLFYQSGALQYHLNQKEAVIDALLPYDNVQIYDFQARTEWITDLNHYIDDGHYGPWINEAIAKDIAAGRCRITDVAAAQANDVLIRALTEQIAAAGCWPDAFDIPQP